MKNELEFKENIKDLTDVMLTTCKCLVDARYYLKIESARDLFTSIMKILRDATLFVGIYLGKGRFGKFSSKLCVMYINLPHPSTTRRCAIPEKGRGLCGRSQ